MKMHLFLGFMFLICFSCVAQKTDSIIYVLHFDSVETVIDKHVRSLEKENTNISFWGYLGRCEEGFKLTICNSPIESKSEGSYLRQLRRNTNRFLLVDDRKIPLLFDYDSIFSTPKVTSVGTLGKREGNVLRSQIILDCFTIIFDDYGKVFRTTN